MTLTSWLTLLSAWGVAVASPGPDFLAVLRTSATAGRRQGAFVGLGVITGIATWMLLALTGLSMLFAQYETAYVITRYLGAGFLVAYGLSIVWKTRRAGGGQSQSPDLEPDAGAAVAQERPTSLVRAWRLGLFTNLANPKALVFFGALLASLVPSHASAGIQLEVFMAIVTVAAGWFALVAWIASMEKIAGSYQRASRRIDRVVGAIFAGVGLSLAFSA